VIITLPKKHTCINAKRDILVFHYTSALKSSKIRRKSKDVIPLLKSCSVWQVQD